MPRGIYNRKPKPQEIKKMTPDEVENMKQEVREKKEMLADATDPNNERLGLQDAGRFQADLKKKEEALQRDEDLVARGKDKDRLFKRKKEIEEQILKGRPTSNQMDLKLGSRESNDAVRQNVEWHRRNIGLAVELQNINRRLEPEDRNASSLEYVRPDKYRNKIRMFV